MSYHKLSEFDYPSRGFLGFDLCENETKQDDPIGTPAFGSDTYNNKYYWVSKNRLHQVFENDINPYLKSIFVDIDDLLYLFMKVDHYDEYVDMEYLIKFLYAISRHSYSSLDTDKINYFIDDINYFAKTGYTVCVSGLKFRIDKNQLDNYRKLIETDTVIDAIDYKNCLVGKIRTKHIECILDNKLIQKP